MYPSEITSEKAATGEEEMGVGIPEEITSLEETSTTMGKVEPQCGTPVHLLVMLEWKKREPGNLKSKVRLDRLARLCIGNKYRRD